MDGEMHAFLDPDKGGPLGKVSQFTGLEPERYVPLEIQAERSRRWTSRTVLYAVLVLAIFNAHSLASWASTLEPNWASVTIRDLSEVWNQRMGAAGFDQPRAGLRSGWEGAKGLTWRRLAGTHLEVVAPPKKR
jgi:hypothetical protein